MNRETVAPGLNSIFYSGNDVDGVVREGAFRARVSVVGNVPSASKASLSPSTIAGFISTAGSDFEFRWTEFQKALAALGYVEIPVWIVGDVSSALDQGQIDGHIDGEISAATLQRVVNELRPRRWIPRTAEAIEAAIRESVFDRETRLAHLKSRRELGHRNRQLHDLQENLEKIVTERTSYLSEAERELHSRAQGTRDLVRFIKELSQTESIEELMILLNQEIRGFHEVRSPILGVVSPEFGARLHFQQARAAGGGKPTARALEKGWGSKSVKKVWPHRSAIRLSATEDQAYLAEELGRPVARTVSIPLARDSGSRVRTAPVLFFEHSFDEAKADRFKKFLIPRIEPLSTALDRIIINREMHAASRLWESTFDGIADPIAVITSRFEILRMNEAFARFPERNRKLCYEVFADRSSPCENCGLKSVVESLQPVSWQARRGSDVYEVNGYPIDFDSSATAEVETGIRTVIHHYSDVTKSLELKGHAFQGEKMAAIGLMAGNIAHELNNPLAGLRSLAQVLAADLKYPKSVRDDMVAIEQAAERSSAIIRDLLEFSKADDRVREKVSLNEIADRSLNMVKTALHEHRVDIEWAPDETVMVEVDPHLLQHVIFNIVNNACQAMVEPGEITLRTRRREQPQGGSPSEKLIEISIADTGPGIPLEIQNRVFEPFFTTKEAGQGTGLGLSMSRWIVESSGGTIELENRKDGTGSIFRVCLPPADTSNLSGDKP